MYGLADRRVARTVPRAGLGSTTTAAEAAARVARVVAVLRRTLAELLPKLAVTKSMSPSPSTSPTATSCVPPKPPWPLFRRTLTASLSRFRMSSPNALVTNRLISLPAAMGPCAQLFSIARPIQTLMPQNDRVAYKTFSIRGAEVKRTLHGMGTSVCTERGQ